MYKPLLPQDQNTPSSSFSVSASSVQRKTKVIKGVVASGVGTFGPVTSAYVVFSVVAATVIIGVVAFFYLKKNKSKVQVPVNSTGLSLETKYENTDLNTVINSVMGISKHAAYLLENSTLARVKKIAAGGGGEIFLAKFMDPALRKKNGENVIQKLVLITNNSAETAFFQEVGIMIMLSTFPNFCKIIGYTENPPSLILQYYPDGSLSDWIYKNRYSTRVAIKIMKEISSAINLMHSHYLAHCDLKPQNVLVKNDNGVPNCYLTDFGITQIISENIVATKSFQVMNLRGLSVQYAAPEAFRNFRSKKYTSVDFKMYDIYSFSCVLFEVFARRVPWI
jgi:serine/threonine protein kinase